PRAAQPSHPSRHWVQIAGGANRAGLPREFARLRAQAPELAGRAAWTTPLNATNRLLVGPFPSSREAQEFVNRLAQREVAAFAWTSPAGQEIERLQTGR
ncbi:MAG TPA: SPOR domain-containing protein, partial [Allosphingosinicella sp.]|nr:SPOR domain-containing protein [Allosphingosinicella sp.]